MTLKLSSSSRSASIETKRRNSSTHDRIQQLAPPITGTPLTIGKHAGRQLSTDNHVVDGVGALSEASAGKRQKRGGAKAFF